MDVKVSDRPDVIGQSSERMQRLRVGITGLAAIVLVVLLTTAVASGLNRRAAQTVVTTPPEMSATINTSDEKTEPLAQLGVAPDAKDVATPAPKAEKR